LNVEELLNSRNIHFIYSGNDAVVKCLNPEHDDNNPSMRIDRLTGVFRCPSCQYSGNIFNLFNVYQNTTSLKVAQIKKKIDKLTVPTFDIPLGAKMFHKDYRNIKADTFKYFNAFTDDTSKLLEGLRERLIFPIYDINGNIVLFHARFINSAGKPKYKNFPPNSSLPLYPQIPTEIIQGSIILVEGFFDMLNLWDKGLKNAVCIFTNNIANKSDRGNVKLLKRFSTYKIQGVNTIVLMPDGDKAGKDGAATMEKGLSSSYLIKKIDLPDGTDPGDLTQEDIDSIKDYLYG